MSAVVPKALPRVRKFSFEALEPRLLLSATPFYSAATAQAGADLALRIDSQGGVDTLELWDSGQGLVGSAALSSLTGPIEIYGSSFDDTLRIDSDLSALAGGILFDGGAGSNTLAGPGADSIWNISGVDAGSVGGVSFSHIANLTGAADNIDSFVFGAGAGLSGTVHGGARGFDTVVLNGTYRSAGYVVTGPDSGNIELDGFGFLFAGMEPIQFTQAMGTFTYAGTIGNDTISLHDIADAGGLNMEISGTGETVQFANPTEALIINGLRGADTITVESLDPAFAADLNIYGYDGGPPGLVSDPLSDSVAFTGNISTNGGYLEVFAQQISVADGITLSTKNPADPDGTNDIVFRARQIGTAELENLSPTLGTARSVSIDIGSNAVLDGAGVYLIAQAEDRTFSEILGIDRRVDTFVIQPVQDKVSDLAALPVKVLVKSSDATITLGDGAQLLGEGTVGVYATASADATGKANSKLFSVGYSQADASAIVDVRNNVVIDAGDAAVVTSSASATANMSTGTERDLGAVPGGNNTQFAVSLAVSNANVISRTTVAQGASITAGKTANVGASGEVASESEAESGLFSDGKAGLAFGLQFSNADVYTTVDGSVTASMNPGSVVKIEIDPTETDPTKPGYVDYDRNMINVGSTALVTEDAIEYSSRRGNSISGLISGQEYVVISVEDDLNTPNIDESQYIQLANSEAEAIAGQAIDLLPGGAIAANNNTKTFDSSQVNGDDDTVALDNAAFTNAGTVDYSFLGLTFELGQAVVYHQGSAPIAGLVDGQTYYVITGLDEFDLQGDSRFIMTQVIQLAETENEARAGVALDIGDAPAGATGYSFEAKHVLDSGFATGVGVISKLSAEDKASASSGLKADDPNAADDDALFDWNSSIFDNVFGKLTESYSANAQKPNAGASSSLNVSGALAFSFARHQVLTDVGATAGLNSNEDLEVKATIEQVLQLSAESTTEPQPGGNNQNTVSVAATIGLFENTAKATVDTGAQLDGLRATRVIALIEYPYLTSPDEFIPSTLGEFVDSLQSEGYDALNKYLDGTGGLKSNFFNTWARSTAKADQVGIAGSVNFLQVGNVAQALVKTGVLINQDLNFRGAANTHPNNTGQQTVSVEASNYFQVIDLTGVFDLQLPAATIDPLSPDFDPSLAVSPIGSSAKRGGVGGAIAIKLVDNTTLSTVEDGAAIFSGADGGFNMKADEAIFGIDFGQSGASAGKFAIGGTVQYTEQNSNTLALLGSGAIVTGRSVSINAASLETQATWTGGVAKGQALGVGAAVSINQVNRKTRASIGDPDQAIASGVIGAQTSIDVSDDVKVRAIANSNLWSFTLAGTLVSTQPDMPAVPTNVPLKAQKVLGTDVSPPSTGIGVAAAVSINIVRDDIQASIVDAGLIKAGGVSVTAEHKGANVAATGGAAIVSGSGQQQGSAALAGAFSLNDLEIDTHAYVIDTRMEVEGDVEITATHEGDLITISAGGAGNTTQQGVSIAGSVSINQVVNDTQAYLGGVDATIGGDVTIEASDTSRIVAVGGGAAYGGKAGVGIGVGANILGSDAKPTVTQAYIDNSTLTIGGSSLIVTATNENPSTDPRITAFGAGIGVAGGNNSQLALGAMLSVNLITANTRAYVRSSTITDDRNNAANALATLIKARDDSGIITIGGAVGLSSTNAIGAAISYAEIDNDILAYFDNVDLSADGTLAIEATSASVIGNGTLGVAAVAGNQGNLAGAGSISINLITNTIDAFIGNTVDDASSIVTGGDVKLTAQDKSLLASVAGGVSVSSKGVAVGAAVSYNLIENTIKAHIDSATVDAQGALSSIRLDASSDSTLVSVAVGVGASAGNFGLGGSLTVNSIANTIDAHIADSNGITATGDVTVKATESDTLVTVAGGFAAAIGGGGNAVGAAIAYNYIGGSFDPANPHVVDRDSANKDQITAYIDNSHVVAGGDIVVNAGYRPSTDPTPTSVTVSGETVTLPQEVKSHLVSVTVGGAAADQFALGGAVSINVVAHDITAYISGTPSVVAEGSILISAADDLVMTSIAGGVALGQNAVGAGVSTQITKNNVEAYVGFDALIDARGNGAGVAVPNGVKDANGVPQATIVKGLAVSATSFETTTTVALGGSGAASAAVAGSAAVTVLNQNTKAYIAENTRINRSTVNESADQSVVVWASDRTRHIGVGGSLAIGGDVGVGAGIDVGVITKNTEARIGSNSLVDAQRDVKVQSFSSEDVTSVAAGLAGSGSVAIAGGVDVYVVDVTTRGFVEGAKTLGGVAYFGAAVAAGGSVQVSAEDSNEMDVIGGSVALGANAGIGGAASIPIVAKTTEAFIGNGAVVSAMANRDGIDVRTGEFDVSFGDYSSDTGEVAPIDTGNSDATDTSLTQQRNAQAGTRSGFKGVAVTAVNQDDIGVFGIGAAAAAVGVQLSVAVNVMTTHTHAFIDDNAKINQVTSGEGAAQSVLVAAGNDYAYLGVAGGLAGGGVAVTPGVNVGVVSGDTRAYIGKSAGVDARQDIEVIAQAEQDMLSIAAAVAGSGTASVAGAISVLVLDDKTYAYIDNAAAVRADGNVVVSASDVTDVDAIAGAVAIGGGAGVGAGIGVNKITKDTQAYVGLAAVVSAGAVSPNSVSVYDDLDKTAGLQSKSIGGVSVQATSSEDVFLAAAAGGASLGFGFAGGVSVNLITANTKAYLGESSNVSSAGSVNVAAFDNVKLQGIAGSLAIGGVAISGGVDVGYVRNDTQAYIGNNARVTATGTVGVNAFSIKDVDSFVVSAAGGGVSLGAAVSVYSIGADLTQDSKDALKGSNGDTLSSTIDSQANTAAIRELLDKYGYAPDSDVGGAIGDARGSLTDPNTSSDLDRPVTGATKAMIGLRAIVTAGDDVNVRAKQQLDFDATVGQGAFGGLVSVGGSVVVANITEGTQASIEPFAQVRAGNGAGDDINVEATLVEHKLRGAAYAGNVGYVSLGAQVVVINDSSRQLAYIDQGSIVYGVDHLNVLASAERPADLAAGGVGVGSLAAGAAIGRANLLGSTTAFVGDSQFTSKPATIRLIANYVNVTADHASTAKVDMFQGAGGIGAGAGNDASAIVTPNITAFIAGNTSTQARNTISITARSEDDADAHAYGVDVGGVSVGVSLATATASPVVDAYFGKGAFVSAGQDVIVQAVHNYKVSQDAQGTRRPITETNPARVQRAGDVSNDRNPDDKQGVLRDYGAYATSFAASGNLVGGNGATSTANASAQLSSHVDTGAAINAGRNVSILSLSLNDSHALSSGVTFSVIAGGGSKTATANALGTTSAYLDGRIAKANNLDVQALSSDTGNAVTDATAAAVGGTGQNSTATTNVKPTLIARIGNQSFDPALALDLANSTIDLGYAHGFANGQGLAYDNGNPKDKAVFDPTKAGVIAGNTIDLGGNYTLATGNSVIYRTGGGAGIGIAGGSQRLIEGQIYYVIATADPNKIQLAATAADAIAGNAIALDGTRATGKLHSVDSNRTGLRILPTMPGGSSQLINGKTYYVIAVAGSPTKVKLAETAADALAGRAIALDPSLVNALALGSGFYGTQQSLTQTIATPFVKLNGNVTVLSNSFTDGDASASGLAGSVGISVDLTHAFTTVSPTLTTFIGQNGSVTALGNVTVQSQQGKAITSGASASGQFDPSTAVQGSDNLNVAGHGFDTGDTAIYASNGGGDIGLEDQRAYHVIKIDDNTLKLGDQFVAANVDGSLDRISFAQPHGFKTGDEVIYGNGGGADTGGMTSGNRYFVKVIDAGTIQLYASKADAIADPLVFSAGAVSANKITLPAGASFGNGQIVTYSTSDAGFDDSIVGIRINADGTKTAAPNTIFLGADYLASHALATGERIHYHTDNKPLTGLTNDTDYFVINNGDGSISLALTAANAAAGTRLAFSVAPTDHAIGANAFTSADVSSDAKGGAIQLGSVAGLATGVQLTYHAQNGVAIGGLVDGANYFVIVDGTLANTIRLAASASLASSGIALNLNANVGSQHALNGSGSIAAPGNYRVIDNGDGTISLAALSGPLTPITLDAAGVFGTQSLSASAIDLTSVANANAQSLSIALKTTANNTKASLLRQGSVTLGTGTADGIASATATGAAYSVLGAGTGSETKVTMDAKVNTFIDKRTTIKGKDVSVLSSSSTELGTSDTNKAGSFVAATDPLASSSMSNSNKAYLGSDVVVNASGKFNLDSRVNQTSNLFVRSEAGGGIGLAGANNASQGAVVTYNNSATVGQNVQITAGGTLDTKASAATLVNLRVEADGAGFGANGKAKVFLTASGVNIADVQDKARLTGTVVTVDAATLGNAIVATNAHSGGFASEAVAQSTLTANLGNQVKIGGKAMLTGSSGINLTARAPFLTAINSALTQTTGAFAGGYPETSGNFSFVSTVAAPADAKFVTNALTHNAQGVVLPVMNATTRDVYSIDFGYETKEATASVVQSDQFAGSVLPFPQPLRAAGPSPAAPTGAMLTQAALDATVASAIAQWDHSGKLDQSQLDTLHQVRFHIEDMDGAYLGSTAGSDISIDRDAAGYGWFVDPTPARSEEFGHLRSAAAQLAGAGSAAYGSMDLLSAINHEIGHLVGLEHAAAEGTPEFMDASIAAGTRIGPFGFDGISGTSAVENAKASGTGGVRVFDEATGRFVARSAPGHGDEDFAWFPSAEASANRESLYAMHRVGAA